MFKKAFTLSPTFSSGFLYQNEDEYTLLPGDVGYPGILRHWDNRHRDNKSYQAIWKDPDDTPDIFTFVTRDDKRVSGFNGEMMQEFVKE